MKIAIASDHAGFQLKGSLTKWITELGHEVLDLGPSDETSVDYPDYAYKLGYAVTDGKADRGILLCGTGIGMCIAANKVDGIIAANVHDTFTARMAAQHNNANVICIGARVTGQSVAEEMVKTWLDTQFEGGRHERRVNKLLNPPAN